MPYDVDFASWKEDRNPNIHKTYASVVARSHHSGIVQAVTMDGAVTNFADDIDLAIWQGLSTRGGGENVGGAFQ
jgi:hypothetical protein